MEGRSAVWLLAALLLEALISAEDQNSPQYLEVGGKLDLRPEPGLFSGTIRSISWKLSGSLVAVLDEGQELAYNPVFGGRAKVDTKTGVLEINNMMKNESGEYKVAINNKIQVEGYDVRVIKRVPKPELVVNPDPCTLESKNCSLSCEGDVTDAGPVTFYIKKGDGYGNWKKEEGTTIRIDMETRDVYEFSCQMENPLGSEDSETLINPFYKFVPSPGAVAGGVVGVIVVLCAVTGGVLYQKKWKNGSMTTTAASTKENGNQEEPLNDRSPDPKEAA